MDWTTVAATLAGGGIGLAGTGLQHRFARKDALTDHSKDEMRTTLGLFVHLSQLTQGMNSKGLREIHAEMSEAVEQIKFHAALISDPETRRRVSELAWPINDPDGATPPDEGPTHVLHSLLSYGRDVLSASIRGDKLPDEPSHIRTYLDEYERYSEEMAAQYEAAHEKWVEERKQAKQPKTAGAED